MDSANLENDQGSGYAFGYFDADREFVELDWTDVTTITMRPDGWGGIEVTETNSGRVVYTCNDSTLGVMPLDRDPITWFKGYRYRGGFEYTCSNGGAPGGERGGPGGLCQGRGAPRDERQLALGGIEGPGGLRPDLRLPQRQAPPPTALTSAPPSTARCTTAWQHLHGPQRPGGGRDGGGVPVLRWGADRGGVPLLRRRRHRGRGERLGRGRALPPGARRTPTRPRPTIPNYNYTVTYTCGGADLGPPEQRLQHRRRGRRLCVGAIRPGQCHRA